MNHIEYLCLNADRISFEGVAPENLGKLDMVIAFDTTGSMAAYIGAVRKEVSDMTNGISTLFQSSCKTARLMEAATMARGSMTSREKFDKSFACYCAEGAEDKEMEEVYMKYKRERDAMDI